MYSTQTNGWVFRKDLYDSKKDTGIAHFSNLCPTAFLVHGRVKLYDNNSEVVIPKETNASKNRMAHEIWLSTNDSIVSFFSKMLITSVFRIQLSSGSSPFVNKYTQ